jgi:hypothetical protein
VCHGLILTASVHDDQLTCLLAQRLQEVQDSNNIRFLVQDGQDNGDGEHDFSGFWV